LQTHTRISAVADICRAMLRVVKTFAMSLKVSQSFKIIRNYTDEY